MTTDRTVLIEHIKNMAQWHIYLTIGNSRHKM